jgi:hypothetical protein
VGGSAIRAVIDAFERGFSRGSRFVSILDGTAVAKFPGSEERKLLADWLSDPRRVERERLWSLGSAVVLPSGTMRALVSAINLVRRPITPQHWTATLSEAVDWGRARLVESGIPLNPQIDALHVELRTHARRTRARA